ncbi:MAG TPA: YceI family protein [Pantanalinema sp.]
MKRSFIQALGIACALFGLFGPKGLPASAAPFERRFAIEEGSQVSYHVTAKIVGLIDDAIAGANRRVKGEIVLVAPNQATCWAQADASDFDSGLRVRDEHVAEILGVPRTPSIRFVLDRLEGFDAGREKGRVTATGTLSVRGRDHALRMPLDYQVSGDRVRIQGEAPLRFSDFGIEPPVVGLVFKRAPDALTIRVSLIAREVEAK